MFGARAKLKRLWHGVLRRWRRLPKPTASVLIALAAAGFTGLQWWEAHSGGEVAKRQADATADLAAASRRVADTAANQVGISETQARAASAQADAQALQAKYSGLLVGVQARLQATEADLAANTQSVQAPRLSLSRFLAVGLGEPEFRDQPGGSMTWDHTNVGGSALTVKHQSYVLMLTPTLPAVIPEASFQQVAPGIQVAPQHNFHVTGDIRFQTSKAEAADLAAGRLNLYLVERLTYADTRERLVSLCLVYRARVSGAEASSAEELPAPAGCFHAP